MSAAARGSGPRLAPGPGSGARPAGAPGAGAGARPAPEPGSAPRLVIDCRSLADGPDRFLTVRRDLAVEGAAFSAARVRDAAVEVDLRVEAAAGGFVARGRIGGVWAGECRRCLEEVSGPLDAPFQEVFEASPVEGETWPVADDRIDLAPAVREAAILALPLAPLCSPDCAGPEPNRFPTGPTAPGDPDLAAGGDPRWAALDQLAFDP